VAWQVLALLSGYWWARVALTSTAGAHSYEASGGTGVWPIIMIPLKKSEADWVLESAGDGSERSGCSAFLSDRSGAAGPLVVNNGIGCLPFRQEFRPSNRLISSKKRGASQWGWGGGRVRPLIVNKAIGRLHFRQDFRPSDGLFHVVFNAMSNACIVTCYVPN
jgi:hypothetical protein